MKNTFASIFGESPATSRARDARGSAFQAMLDARRGAAEQRRTDAAAMARYNAFGNLLTTMVQPLGWAAGGGGRSTGTVQPYDDRQYIDAFNRAVKADEDLRNIGIAEAEGRYQIAADDYRRMQSLEDSERQQERMLERQERAARAREERDRKLHDQRMELEERKASAKRQLEEWKATHRVTSRGTGLSVQDRVMLKNIDAYNDYANTESEYGRTPISFSDWLTNRGYDVKSASNLLPDPMK